MTKLGIAGAVLIFAAMLVGLLHQPKPPVVVLPNPNGYDDFIQAAQAVILNADYRSKDAAQLRESVEKNANALALVRSGLTKQCRVPVVYNEAYVTNLLNELAACKQLAFAFTAEGRLAEQTKRTNDALRIYLDLVKFGKECGRGGVLISKLVSLNCEALGTQELRRLSAGLSASDTQNLLEALTRIQSNEESLESWLEPEKVWSRTAYKNWRYALARWTMRRTMRAAEQKATDKYYLQQTELRLLRADLALRLYRLEKGAYPNRLEDLVPRYLDSVPIDPFSNQPLVYRPKTGSYLLYSVGPDRTDDAGVQSTSKSQGKGDLLSTAP